MIPGKVFAFIEASNGNRLFIHKDDFEDDWDTLRALFGRGNKPIPVTFEMGEDLGKGPRAAKCKLLKFDDDMIGNN